LGLLNWDTTGTGNEQFSLFITVYIHFHAKPSRVSCIIGCCWHRSCQTWPFNS